MKNFLIAVMLVLLAVAAGFITVINDSLVTAQREVNNLHAQLDAIGIQLAEADAALEKSEQQLAVNSLRLDEIELSYAELSANYTAALESLAEPSVRVVEVIKEVVVEKAIPITIEPWQSLEELEAFLEADHITIVLQAGEDGEVQITDQCEDIAIQVCEHARAAGRLIETEILTASEVREYYTVDRPDAPHMICKAVIGNCVYFIEPAGDRAWLAYYLDEPEED